MGMSRAASLPKVPMINLRVNVSPEVALAVGEAARAAKTSEGAYLRKLVLNDAGVQARLHGPHMRRFAH